LFSVSTSIPASEIDWSVSWNLVSTCPEGALWVCEPDQYGAQTGTTVKGTDKRPTFPKFKPFMAYQVAEATCGTSRVPAMRDTVWSTASSWLDINVEGWLSMGLEIGVASNPGLKDSTDITPASGPASLDSAIALMIRNRRMRGMFDRPVLHIPEWYMSVLDDNSWVRRAADIAFGPGYGVHPLIAPPSDSAWIYLTGPIEYSLGDTVESQVGHDGMELRRKNATFEVAEQFLNYRFDPCGTFKCLVVTC
jgi:hypothetical protein